MAINHEDLELVAAVIGMTRPYSRADKAEIEELDAVAMFDAVSTLLSLRTPDAKRLFARTWPAPWFVRAGFDPGAEARRAPARAERKKIIGMMARSAYIWTDDEPAD